MSVPIWIERKWKLLDNGPTGHSAREHNRKWKYTILFQPNDITKKKKDTKKCWKSIFFFWLALRSITNGLNYIQLDMHRTSTRMFEGWEIRGPVLRCAEAQNITKLPCYRRTSFFFYIFIKLIDVLGNYGWQKKKKLCSTLKMTRDIFILSYIEHIKANMGNLPCANSIIRIREATDEERVKLNFQWIFFFLFCMSLALRNCDTIELFSLFYCTQSVRWNHCRLGNISPNIKWCIRFCVILVHHHKSHASGIIWVFDRMI